MTRRKKFEKNFESQAVIFKIKKEFSGENGQL